MREVRIALIGGAGWMGKTHALIYASAPVIFGNEPARPILEIVAEATDEIARKVAADCGARRWTSNWREAVEDPNVDVVDIVTPNSMHREMALAAAAAGKHVYCEKPLGLNADETREMLRAVNDAGVLSLVGHNFPHNPIHAVARDLIRAGDLGDIVHARVSFNSDFLADEAAPFIWRCDRAAAGSGTLGDINVHLFSLTEYLVGPIAEVFGRMQTVVKERDVVADASYGSGGGTATGERRTVDTDDSVHMLATFENGCTGIFDTSRVAHGRKIEISYDIVGRAGSIRWTYDRLNELQVYTASDPVDRSGFKRIETGPSHPYYGDFFPIANIGMGYNEIKAIEVRELVRAAAGGSGRAVAGLLGRAPDPALLRRDHPVRRRAALGVGERDPGVARGAPAGFRRTANARTGGGVRARAAAQDQCWPSGPSAP